MKNAPAMLVAGILSTGLGYALAGAWTKESPPETARPEKRYRLSAMGGVSRPLQLPAFAEEKIAGVWAQESFIAQLAAADSWSQITDLAEIKALLNLINELPSNSSQTTATAALFKAWMNIDPVGACRWCETLAQSTWLETCLDHWAAIDPEAAIEFAENSSKRSDALPAALDSISRTDPEFAFQQILRFDLSERIYAYRDVIARYTSAIGPAEAMRRAESFNGKFTIGALNIDLKEAAVEEWAKTDPAEAVAWWKNDRHRAGFLDELLENLPPSTWDYGMKMALNLTGEERSIALDALTEWADKDPKAALVAYYSNEGLELLGNSISHNLLERVAKQDPHLALSFIDPNDPPSPVLAARIENELRAIDPDEADRWLATLPEEQRTAIQSSREEERKIKPPPRTLDEFLDHSLKNGTFSSNHFGLLSPVEREKFVNSVAALDDDQRGNLGKMITNMDSDQVQLGAELLTLMPANSPGDNDVERKASHIAAQWARQTPAEAAEWVARLPEGKLRSVAARSVAHQWRFFDPEAANRWAASLPDEASRSAAQAGVQTP